MSIKKELLDPLGTTGRLITLYFRPVGTRFGISDHIVRLQLPETGQGLFRYLGGDNRDDISVLFSVVIQRLIEWFIIPLYDYKNKKKKSPIKTRSFIIGKMEEQKQKVENIITNISGQANSGINKPEEDMKGTQAVPEIDETIYLKVDDKDIDEYWKCIEKLAKYLCCGLTKLQKTYDSGNVIFALQYYINLLKDAIKGNYGTEKLPECLVSKDDNKNFLDYNKIKNLWEFDKIKEITDLFEKCFEMTKETVEEEKAKKIEGYLKAVEHLLDISDVEFRNLIQGIKSG